MLNSLEGAVAVAVAAREVCDELAELSILFVSLSAALERILY